jgi:carnitine-CoA ligase
MPAPTALPVPRLHPYVDRDVPWLLQQRVRTHGDRPYIVWDPFEGAGRVITYREFGEAVEHVAGGLVEHGIERGDFVLIHLGNCPEFLIAWHACARIGAIAVTTNTRSSREELAYYAADCGAVAAVTQPALVDLVAACMPAARWIAATATDLGAPPAAFSAPDVVPFEKLRGAPERIQPRPRDPLAFNSVQYTSGTTARPKGVVWTHANVLWGAQMTATHLRLTERDVALVYFPLFHTNSLMYASLGSLWGGGSIVVLPRYSASRFWERAIRHRCTWACTSPFVLRTLAEHPVPARHFFRFWGSGTTDPPLARTPFNVQGLGWFGMTETVTFPLIGVLDLPSRALGMGRPAAGYEIAVVRDDGAPVGVNEAGKLLVRGVPGISLFYEYLNNPAATAAAFDERGWMDTGDVATVFEDGDLRFEGRGKDMLRVGAENVAAAEIERVIASVAGVLEAAVVGKPDEFLGEVPVAFVIAADGVEAVEQRVIDACREQLADFKMPRAVLLVSELPRSTLNKVSKKDLRAALTSVQEGR